MAMQKKCTLIDIKDAGEKFKGKMFTCTVRLDCWKDGDNPETDPVAFTSTQTANYKIVDGMTAQQQLLAWAKDLKKKFQPLVNAYVAEENMKSNDDVKTTLTALATDIGG